VVTFEFENVPSAATSAIESLVACGPARGAAHLTAARPRKQFLADRGFPTVPPRVAATQGSRRRLSRIGMPAIVKTAEGRRRQGQHVAASATRPSASGLARPQVLVSEAHHPAGRAR
jgi:5-(carboxyamino)imidazole ribonucleotide synthase